VLFPPGATCIFRNGNNDPVSRRGNLARGGTRAPAQNPAQTILKKIPAADNAGQKKTTVEKFFCKVGIFVLSWQYQIKTIQ
jgi:hypothetical protein